ncbi:fluoride efflux transporter CrcB [Rhizobium paknamense]|uniref:Fluoride-specific ion channel FluC n=1 Tax=Rhizobium paknamense TaxID=1206817 RepID=A0ABU0ICB3_9HYPH|nr:fluoride efflux transporter CrcB [Rhizobium paknamense]MDQ0455883.1 CrcB protein [Rhizobium paknamense]
MKQLLFVVLGGGFGSLLRYWVGLVAIRLFGPFFPWGTFAVNLIGSFCIGLFAEMLARRFNASEELRLLLITGILGGFTTFSAFSLDAVTLFNRGDTFLALVYVTASVVLAIAAVFGGLAVGRALF